MVMTFAVYELSGILILLRFCFCSRICTCNTLTLTPSQCAQQCIFVTRTSSISVKFSTTITFDKFQERCRSRILLHFKRFHYLCLLYFAHYPTPLCWIKIISNPCLDLVIYTVAVISGSIRC